MKRAGSASRTVAYALGEAIGSDERRRELLAAASRLSAELAPLEDVDSIASTTVEELHASFGYYIAVIHRLDPDGMLRPVAGAGRPGAAIPDCVQPAGRPPGGGRRRRAGEQPGPFGTQWIGRLGAP